MSDPALQPAPQPGALSWTDLTVADADRVRDFYVKVVGWKPQAVDMGGYCDYAMVAPAVGARGRGAARAGNAVHAEKMVAGVCWKRGVNADLPSQWLIYLNVADLARSVKSCKKLGGAVLAGPRPLSGGTVAVIRDPAGAVCALFELPASPRVASRPARKKRKP